MVAFEERLVRSKKFRRLNDRDKLLVAILLHLTNSCGVVNTDMGVISLIISEGEDKLPAMIRSVDEIVSFDDDTEEIYFNNYIAINNPFTSSHKHRVKFQAEHRDIKSEKLIAIIAKEIVEAKRLATSIKLQQTNTIPPPPKVDK